MHIRISTFRSKRSNKEFIMKNKQGMKELKAQRDKLMKELIDLDGWIIGSLVNTTRIQAKQRKPFCYLSRSKKGKNSITYVSAEHKSQFTEMIQTGYRARELFERISELTIMIVKSEKGIRSSGGENE